MAVPVALLGFRLPGGSGLARLPAAGSSMQKLFVSCPSAEAFAEAFEVSAFEALARAEIVSLLLADMIAEGVKVERLLSSEAGSIGIGLLIVAVFGAVGAVCTEE